MLQRGVDGYELAECFHIVVLVNGIVRYVEVPHVDVTSQTVKHSLRLSWKESIHADVQLNERNGFGSDHFHQEVDGALLECDVCQG